MEPPAKKPREEPSSSTSSPPSSSQTEDEESSSEILNDDIPYDVLRLIFQFLKIRDLARASQVCRSWRDAACNEANIRREPFCLIRRFDVFEKLDVLDSYDVSVLGQNLWAKSGFSLICVLADKDSKGTSDGIQSYSNSVKCNKVYLGGYMIVANDTKISNGLPNFEVTVAAFLPKIVNLNYQIYNINQDTCHDKKETDAHLKLFVKKLLQPEKSQCILMLTHSSGYGYMKRMAKYFEKTYTPGKIALWGGHCTFLKTNSESKQTTLQSNYLTAISLSSPSLQSWSVVLSRSCDNETEIQERLENFRKKLTLKKYSLGLMYACIARSNSRNLEIAVFKRIFPEMELIGLHGDGEYGLNTFVKERESRIRHEYSTVFLILTYE